MTDIVSEAEAIAQQRFGYTSLRDYQRSAITGVMEGRDVLVVLPTSAGKSACYQIPAMMCEGLIIVFSPLIALMKDQVDKLKKWGVPAARLGGDMNDHMVQRVLYKIRDYRILFIAPERLKSKEFVTALKKVNVAFVVVDEAHCLAHQMRDFRPAYTLIGDLMRKHLTKAPRMALTATADQLVEHDVRRVLDMKEGEYDRIIASPRRDNLEYRCVQEAEPVHLWNAVRGALFGEDKGAAVVYAGTRARVVEIAKQLRDMAGIAAREYHAGMSGDLRTEVQDRFMANDIRCIVATNAFGMGIDKPDIRLVYHADPPGSIHDYAQESGRAGRDGKPSLCVLNVTEKGIRSRRFFIRTSNPSFNVFFAVWKELLDKQPIKEPFMLNDLAISKAVCSAGGVSLFDSSFVASSVLAYLEYERHIVTKLDRTVHSLVLRDRVGAAKMRHRYPNNVRVRNTDVLVTTYAHDTDIVGPILRSGCAVTDPDRRPISYYRTMKMRDKLSIDPQMLAWKKQLDERKFAMLLEFVRAPDKQRFLESVFI